jgi:hypothetical protein
MVEGHGITIHSLTPAVRATCSCGLWEFQKARDGNTDKDLKGFVGEAFALHLDTMNYEFRVEGGPEVEARYERGAKGCYPFTQTHRRTGRVDVGVLCIRTHPKDRLPRCSVCGTRAGEYLCDFPEGEGTCDAGLCAKCTTAKGRGTSRVDYCPAHRVAGFSTSDEAANHATGRADKDLFIANTWDNSDS